MTSMPVTAARDDLAEGQRTPAANDMRIALAADNPGEDYHAAVRAVIVDEPVVCRDRPDLGESACILGRQFIERPMAVEQVALGNHLAIDTIQSTAGQGVERPELEVETSGRNAADVEQLPLIGEGGANRRGLQ